MNTFFRVYCERFTRTELRCLLRVIIVFYNVFAFLLKKSSRVCAAIKTRDISRSLWLRCSTFFTQCFKFFKLLSRVHWNLIQWEREINTRNFYSKFIRKNIKLRGSNGKIMHSCISEYDSAQNNINLNFKKDVIT